MGRFAPVQATTGTVKSIQHASRSISNNNNYTITISSVDTNKSIINSTGSFFHFSGAQGNDVRDRSGGQSSPARASFQDSTNILLNAPNIDIFSANFSSSGGTWAGTVVEYS
tara:strand:- start:936 stop:1271 length:336 start_codon:yes stop_codon:yes gene_type:complete